MCDKKEGFTQGSEYYSEVPQEPNAQYIEGFRSMQRQLAKATESQRKLDKELRDQERAAAQKRIQEREAKLRLTQK